MNIAVIGAGYVGLVTGTCFAELGNQVTCIDVDLLKIANLKAGILPIYEPGLEEMVNANLLEKRLHFASSLTELSESPDIIFIAVGTPSDIDGSADMQYVLNAAAAIGSYLTKYCVIVDKSTVPVGVADQVERAIRSNLQQRHCNVEFDVVSNPEFLREGAAITDFLQPDRVVIGNASDRAKQVMLDLYLPIMRSTEKIFFMSVKDAEMTKYVANAMLATKISFMNEIAVLCEAMGVDVDNVRMGIGSDSRIGNAFIHPGCGYGGSCFPKDVKALIHMAEQNNIDPLILHAIEERNFHQKQLLSKKVIQLLGEDLTQKTIAVWGLAFKPGTDDIREASSLVLIEELLLRNATVKAYDPAAIPNARAWANPEWINSNKLSFAENQYDVLDDADIVVLVTEWKSFCYPDLALMKKKMRLAIIVDGRNQYDPAHLTEAGFAYYGIGRHPVSLANHNLEKHVENAKKSLA